MQTSIPPQLLARLSEILASRTGLHFPVERWNDLELGIATAAPAFDMADAESCARHLVSTPLTHREIEILASYLTVGETYFFREPRSFEVLEQQVLPPLLHERANSDHRLRIWSAGCCTGEEPYSIAMLLDRMIPQPDAWNITLLATDINPAFLSKARTGEYGEWSFRNTPRWIRDRYFRPAKPGQFRLSQAIRRRVTFSYLNLADDVYPSLTTNTNAMDIIFCRNVLMYFSPERARAVLDNFHRALVDGGWLIVSPAETSTSLFTRFRSINFEGATLYRKQAGDMAWPITPAKNEPVIPAGWPLPAQAASLTPVQTIPQPAEKAPVEVSPITADPGSAAVAARNYANQGKLGEAAEWCRKAIAADKLDPRHHYLLAIIQQEQGQLDEAAHSLIRALYLDPDFVVAHYAFGNLRQLQGRHREAERHFDHALSSLRNRPPNEMLPEADGLSAGRLLEIIAAMQTGMTQAATSH